MNICNLEASRVLVVGEAPSRTMEFLGTQTSPLMREDLAILAGVKYPDEWAVLFARTNIFDHWPGPQGAKGDAFPLAEARTVVARAAREISRFQRVVLLGRRVQSAFGIQAPWFKWVERWGTSIATCPHPSRVSRWWNEVTNVERAAIFWREVAAWAQK